MSIEFVVFDLDAVTVVHDSTIREVFGMTPALRRLRARGVKIAITTARTRMDAHHALGQLGWLGSEIIDACVTSSDVPRSAPFPDMVPHAMNELDVRSAAHVAKVSGTPLGLLQGATAGCAVLIGVLDRGTPRRRCAVRRAPTWRRRPRSCPKCSRASIAPTLRLR
jgi:beta-phosphoglucomutase-like phosphatase (HAD superfamily)